MLTFPIIPVFRATNKTNLDQNMKKLLLLLLLFTSFALFANKIEEIKKARKLADTAFNQAKESFKSDSEVQGLDNKIKALNVQIRQSQSDAGIKADSQPADKKKLMAKLSKDKKYRELNAKRNKLTDELKAHLMTKDENFKSKQEAFLKLWLPLQKKNASKKKLPKTTTALSGGPSKAMYVESTPIIEKATTLWYNYPAGTWLDAVPFGNGSFGGVSFGGVTKDIIQFNHDTLWTPPSIPDEFIKGNYPDKTAEIKQIRELIFAGKYFEAGAIGNDKVQLKYDVGSYQPFAELHFEYDFAAKLEKGSIVDYHRTLDMETAVAATHFKIANTTYTREVFAAKDKSIIAMRFTAVGGDKISTRINLKRPYHFEHQKATTESLDNNAISIAGTAHGDKVSPYATKYEAIAKAFSTDGSISSENGVLSVKDCSEFVIVLSGSTNFNIDEPFKALTTNLRDQCQKLIKSFEKKGWDTEKTIAVKAHNDIFKRVDISIGEKLKNDIPTNLRIRQSREMGEKEYDHYLTMQLFHFGRYLFIASSRPGSLAVNLRGIWSSDLKPAWNSDYHHDINVQMSYWSAENTNMSECHIPLFDLMKQIRPRGRAVASKVFGARGVFMPLCHGVYMTAYPPMPPRCIWAMAGAWNTSHVMEHYRFGQDKDYLKKEGYDIIKDHLLFCLDWLVVDPRNGKLVAGPDYSPETAFALNEADKKQRKWGNLDMGLAMDQQLVHQLFCDFLEASAVLGVNDELVKEVKEKLPQLAPTQIGADGTIMEWSGDYLDSEPDHRHISHMWAMYPGDQFHVDNAPEMMEAGSKTLDVRTDTDRSGKKVTWSNVYYINFYARFGMAEKALFWVNNLNRIRGWNMNMMGSQGLVNEANYGYPGAVTEMLMQSHTGEIKLLPALPKAWDQGRISGVVARGGFEVSFQWSENKLKSVSILSKYGNPCTLNYKGNKIKLELSKGESKSFEIDSNEKFIEKKEIQNV